MTSPADPRHLARLPIRLAGTDERGNRFVQTAFTRDISVRGARLAQVPPLLSPAAVVEVEYRRKRSQFRVVWVGGPAKDEVGLVSLERGRCIWGTPLPGQPIPASAGLPSSERPSLPEQKRKKRRGFFCNDPGCRKMHRFHLIADDKILWDIWPQKIECPLSGKSYEYRKEDIRSAGYV